MNLVPYFSLFKNTIIPTNDESSHRYYSKMESIVRPLLFIYSKTCSTRSKFNYHSNYSPSSTIIYVTRTLILKRRSAHRFYLDSISKVSFPNQYPTSSSLFKTMDARRSLEDLSKGKGEEEEKEEDSCSTGPAGALQDPFSFWSSKISRGNVAGLAKFEGRVSI